MKVLSFFFSLLQRIDITNPTKVRVRVHVVQVMPSSNILHISYLKISQLLTSPKKQLSLLSANDRTLLHYSTYKISIVIIPVFTDSHSACKSTGKTATVTRVGLRNLKAAMCSCLVNKQKLCLHSLTKTLCVSFLTWVRGYTSFLPMLLHYSTDLKAN